MNNNWQAIRLVLTAVFAVAFCCQCKTNDETKVITSMEEASKFGKFGKLEKVGMKKQGGYKFASKDNEQIEKSEGAERISSTLNNEKVVKNSKGEVVRKEKREDLYQFKDNMAKESGSRIENQMAKIKESKFAEKEFKTPEYLKRQEFATKTFEDGSRAAKESGSVTERFTKMFKTKNSSLENEVARESNSTNSRFDKMFKTKNDSITANAITDSVKPIGIEGLAGYQDNANLSMDDVKKMVSPESFRP